MRPIGILGGMGPEASADVYSKIIQRSYAYASKNMEAYPHILINNIPKPNIFQRYDRETGIYLGQQARILEDAGARAIGVACNSAHYYWPQMRSALSPQVWLVDMIGEVAKRVQRDDYGVIGLLSSSMSRPLYEKALLENGTQLTFLSGDEQNQVDTDISRILAGERTPLLQSELLRLAEDQIRRGSRCVVLGCTDLPIILKQADVPFPLVASNDVLADVLFSFALKEE